MQIRGRGHSHSRNSVNALDFALYSNDLIIIIYELDSQSRSRFALVASNLCIQFGSTHGSKWPSPKRLASINSNFAQIRRLAQSLRFSPPWHCSACDLGWGSWAKSSSDSNSVDEGAALQCNAHREVLLCQLPFDCLLVHWTWVRLQTSRQSVLLPQYSRLKQALWAGKRALSLMRCQKRPASFRCMEDLGLDTWNSAEERKMIRRRRKDFKLMNF